MDACAERPTPIGPERQSQIDDVRDLLPFNDEEATSDSVCCDKGHASLLYNSRNPPTFVLGMRVIPPYHHLR